MQLFARLDRMIDVPALTKVPLSHRVALNELVVQLSRPPKAMTYPPAAYLRALRAYMRMSQHHLGVRSGETRSGSGSRAGTRSATGGAHGRRFPAALRGAARRAILRAEAVERQYCGLNGSISFTYKKR